MPVDKQVLLRYQVLNRCFRNRYKEYTMEMTRRLKLRLVYYCIMALARY